jgi:prepilin-type processing-associated H-X9-DG protein
MATTNPQYDNRPDPPKPRPPVLDYARPKPNAGANVKAIVAVCCIFAFALLLVSAWLFGEPSRDSLIGIGLLLSILCLPLLAIMFGLRGLLNANRNKGKGRYEAIMELCLGVFAIFLLVSLLSPGGGHPRERGNRVKCASNLKQIGTSIFLYLNDHPGPLPPDLGSLIIATDMTSQMYVCPSTDDVPAGGADPQAVVQTLLSEKDHMSYVYLGAGMTADKLTFDQILAYEPLSNHAGEGINVLYGDGHAQWFDKKQAAHVIAELQAGHNPPRP